MRFGTEEPRYNVIGSVIVFAAFVLEQNCALRPHGIIGHCFWSVQRSTSTMRERVLLLRSR